MGTPAAYAAEATEAPIIPAEEPSGLAVAEDSTQHDDEAPAPSVAEDEGEGAEEPGFEDPGIEEAPATYDAYLNVEARDAQGNLRDEDAALSVGDTVSYTITIANGGETPLTGVVVTSGTTGLVPVSGSWNEPCTIGVAGEQSFVARYVVGPGDDDIYLTALVSYGGETRNYTPRPFRVEATASYGYTVNYYRDAVSAEGYLGSIPGTSPSQELVFLEEELLNAYLPEVGYRAKTSADFTPVTLTADGSTVIDVVYEADASVEPDPVQTALYTVYYYTAGPDGSTNLEDCVPCGIYKSAAQVGSTVTLVPGTGKGQLDYCLPVEGYDGGVAVDGVTELVIGEDAHANVLRVIYTPQSFAYGITFYAEGTGDPLGRIEGTALYGSTVHFDASKLNQYLPAIGYVARNTGLDLVIGAGAGENEVRVTYALASYRYTVNYYKDSVSEDNRLGAPYEGLGKYGQTVYNIPLNTYCPDGYRQIEDSRSVTITADEAQNVVNIVYEKRDDIGYTVNYYRDGILGGELLGTDRGTGTLGEDIPYTSGKYCPAGYDSNAELQGVKVICAYESSNVLNVVYVRKASYAYEVRYYKDSISPQNMIGAPVTGVAPYQTAIPYDLGLRVPSGYTSLDAQLSGAQMVGSDVSRNVLNIVYSKDNAIPYIVNYYLGSLDGERIAQVRGAGTFEDPIPYDAAAYLRPGYSGAAQLSGVTRIGADAAANVLNVVLPRASYGYTVNYYRDAITEENLIVREQGNAPYLSEFSYDIAGHVPQGYNPQAMVTGSAIVSYDEAANVLNVVYRRALFGYTVNYYGGGISESQLLTSITYEPRSFGSNVELSADELNAQRPQGYAMLDQGVSIIISADEATNVASVVFYPDFSDFYSAGLASLDAVYDGSVHYVTAQGVVQGDIITYVYSGAMQTRIVGTDANIGAEFRELTDGELPVLVTFTRGGITSNALRTTVRIGPAPVPDPTPVDPEPTPDQPQPADPPVDELPANPLPDDVPDMTADNPAVIGPVLAAVGEALGIDGTPQADAATIQPGQTTIEDDANPLASPQDIQPSGMASVSMVGYLLMLLAAVCMLAALALLVVRRRLVNQISLVKTSEAVIHRARVTKVTRGIVILGVAAVVLCALWGIFLI